MKLAWGKVSWVLGWPLVVLVVASYLTISVYLDERRYKQVVGREAIERLLRGHTLIGLNFRFYYRPNGTAEGQVDLFYDQGTWYADETGYCEQWTRWADGALRCWSIEFDQTRVRRVLRNAPSDSEKTELERLAGNHIGYSLKESTRQ